MEIVEIPRFDGFRLSRGDDHVPGIIHAIKAKAGITTSAAFRMAAYEASDSMASAVTVCLGPDGLMRAAVDMVGNTSFTSHGAALIKKTRSEHPVTVYLLQTLQRHMAGRGDGSIRWVLLVRELLRALLQLSSVPSHVELHHATSDVVRIAKETLAAHTVKRTIPQITSTCITSVVDSCCSGGVLTKMTQILTQYLTAYSETEEGVDFLKYAPPEAHTIHTIIGAAFSGSCVIEGTLFHGHLRTISKMPKGVKGGRVVLLKGRPLIGKDGGYASDSESSGSEGGEEGSCFDDGGNVDYEFTKAELSDASEWVMMACKMFVAALGNCEIHCVLSSVKLPDAVLSDAAELGIMICDTIDTKDVPRMGSLLQIEPIEPSVFLHHYSDPSGGHINPNTDTAMTTFVEIMRTTASVDSGSFVRIVPFKVVPMPLTLLISGQSSGVASESVDIVRRVLTSLRWCLRRDAMYVGGCWKDWLLVAAALRRGAKACHASAWVMAVSYSMEAVVTHGVLNSIGERTEQNRQWVQRLIAKACAEAKGIVSTLHVLQQLDSEIGDIVEVMSPEPLNIWEHAESLPDLLLSCLSSVALLARIDALVPSKRLCEKTQSEHVTQTHLV